MPRQRGRPIAAILNSHWHLDHTTGNPDIRQVYPRAEVYATTAIEGALVGFLGRNRAQADKMLADPKTAGGAQSAAAARALGDRQSRPAATDAAGAQIGAG